MTPDTHDGRAPRGDRTHDDGKDAKDAKNAKNPPAHVHTRDDNDRTEEIFGHLEDDRFPRFAVIRNPTMMERAAGLLARMSHNPEVMGRGPCSQDLRQWFTLKETLAGIRTDEKIVGRASETGLAAESMRGAKERLEKLDRLLGQEGGGGFGAAVRDELLGPKLDKHTQGRLREMGRAVARIEVGDGPRALAEIYAHYGEDIDRVRILAGDTATERALMNRAGREQGVAAITEQSQIAGQTFRANRWQAVSMLAQGPRSQSDMDSMFQLLGLAGGLAGPALRLAMIGPAKSAWHGAVRPLAREGAGHAGRGVKAAVVRARRKVEEIRTARGGTASSRLAGAELTRAQGACNAFHRAVRGMGPGLRTRLRNETAAYAETEGWSWSVLEGRSAARRIAEGAIIRAKVLGTLGEGGSAQSSDIGADDRVLLGPLSRGKLPDDVARFSRTVLMREGLGAEQIENLSHIERIERTVREIERQQACEDSLRHLTQAGTTAETLLSQEKMRIAKGLPQTLQSGEIQMLKRMAGFATLGAQTKGDNTPTHEVERHVMEAYARLDDRTRRQLSEFATKPGNRPGHAPQRTPPTRENQFVPNLHNLHEARWTGHLAEQLHRRVANVKEAVRERIAASQTKAKGRQI